MIEGRLKKLNNSNENLNGEYILYWMQQSCRLNHNHALNFAIEKANEFKVPLLVSFVLCDSYLDGTERAYYFLLEGLKEISTEFEKLGITFCLKIGDIEREIKTLSEKSVVTVMDKGYLKIQRKWRENLKNQLDVICYEVDSDLLVPVEIASKVEVERAFLMREKIEEKLDIYLKEFKLKEIENKNKIEIHREGILNILDIIKNLKIDKTVEKSRYFIGGYTEGKKLLDIFLKENLKKYNKFRNNPNEDVTSKLSPYLYFGQISSSEILLELKKLNYSKKDIKFFYNELVGWRELSYNFCYYNQSYDIYSRESLGFGYETLEKHKKDKRKYIYSIEELENAKTHDKLWNATQLEMKETGRMNGYMRIFWCKKIIEWSENPKEAFERAIYLNNKYELDERDANTASNWKK